MVSTSVLYNVQNMSGKLVVIIIALSLHNIHCSRRPVDMFTSWKCVHHGHVYIPYVVYQLVRMMTLPAMLATEAWWQLKLF